MDELLHYGVKGMKWGRRKQKDVSFHKESNQKIITNKDGSQTIPKGFVFIRVGRMPLDVNASGALYVSHGKLIPPDTSKPSARKPLGNY